MQATPSAPSYSPGHHLLRNAGWFLAVPLFFLVLVTLTLAVTVTGYQARHADRIYTGVSVWGRDLSRMTPPEAEQALAAAFPYAQQQAVTLTDAATGQSWSLSLADLGMSLDAAATANVAYQIGRGPSAAEDVRAQFETWYYGRQVAPVIIIDEARLDPLIAQIAADVDRPPVDAILSFDGNQVGYTPAQAGRALDKAQLRTELLAALGDLRHAQLPLPVIALQPRVADAGESAQRIQNIIGSPMTFYLQEPLADDDLTRMEIPPEELKSWLHVEAVTQPDGTLTQNVTVDENGVRNWLMQISDRLYRAPVNARFYFDDNTQELVVVEPHVSGRQLDVDATVAEFMRQVYTPNRSLPFVVTPIVPAAHAGATAAELGITELVSESTTWFAGSSPERKHNIARAAANFYGIIIAPGETFSFNHFLGDISEEEGYETGLIIFGGRTIEGVGGGVCQVSTTLFQSAFWAGFPILERWAHGYRVGYYEAGEGPGMDATVFSPLVDLRFVNNTPYYLLIENYYNETYESLWFKFYSTSMGRTVTKSDPVVRNIQPAKPDIWEYNEELPEGEIEQVDWAAEGSDVSVHRTVYNRDGQVIIDEDIISHYVPWQNIYQYGPGVEPPSPPPPPTPTPPPSEETPTNP